MKKIFLSLMAISCMGLASFAQAFEGQVTYSIDVKGENAALFAAMMPNSIDMYFLGNDMMYRTNGGITSSMMGDIVTKGAENLTYMVVHSKKTVYKIDPSKDKKVEASELPKVTLEGTEKVNGYSCKKYLVKFPKKEDSEMYQYMWCTTDLKINRPAISTSAQSSYKMFLDGVEGFPVKMDMYIKAKGMEINQELNLTKISQNKPDASLFVIPSKYKMEDFDEKKFAGGMK